MYSVFSVHSTYSVYSAYSTYSVYSVNSVYLAYNMYSVYSAYNAYSVLFPRPLGQQLRLGPKSPKELLFMLSMVSQKSKVRSISKFYDRCKSIRQNVSDAQQY